MRRRGIAIGICSPQLSSRQVAKCWRARNYAIFGVSGVALMRPERGGWVMQQDRVDELDQLCLEEIVLKLKTFEKPSNYSYINIGSRRNWATKLTSNL